MQACASPQPHFLTSFLTLVALKTSCRLLVATQSSLLPHGLCTCCALCLECSSFCLHRAGCFLLPRTWLTLVLLPFHLPPSQIGAHPPSSCPKHSFLTTLTLYHPGTTLYGCANLKIPALHSQYSLQHLKVLLRWTAQDTLNSQRYW